KLSGPGLSAEAATLAADQSLVCFGHVDLEQGVAALYPLLPGRVTKVEVRETEAVRAGTVLLRLDDQLARLRVKQAAANLEAARRSELELYDASVAVKRGKVEVDIRQAELEQATRGVRDCLVTAPVDGTVLRILVSPGDVLGAQPKQAAVLFCPDGQRIIRAE